MVGIVCPEIVTMHLLGAGCIWVWVSMSFEEGLQGQREVQAGQTAAGTCMVGAGVGGLDGSGQGLVEMPPLRTPRRVSMPQETGHGKEAQLLSNVVLKAAGDPRCDHSPP